MHPASRFWGTREKLSLRKIRSLLSIRFMLLGYIFKPRANSRALSTEGSVMSLDLIIARGQCVSGHVASLSWSRIRHRNDWPRSAWKGAVQRLGKVLLINGCSHSKRPVWRELWKQDWLVQKIGLHNFKGLMWFTQSLLFSSSIKKKKKGSSARWVEGIKPDC